MEPVTFPKRIHPLIGVAAVAVTLVSLVGVAAITGLLPTSHGAIAPPMLASDTSASTAPQQPNLSTSGAPPAALANNQQADSQPAHTALAVQCANCGHVEAIRAVQHTPQTSGVGMVAGALLGGIIGHQVGAGNGRTLATVAGAGAGGYAGNAVEKNSHTSTSYVIEVRMDSGKLRSFPEAAADWHVGDQVRVVHGHLEGLG